MGDPKVDITWQGYPTRTFGIYCKENLNLPDDEAMFTLFLSTTWIYASMGTSPSAKRSDTFITFCQGFLKMTQGHWQLHRRVYFWLFWLFNQTWCLLVCLEKTCSSTLRLSWPTYRQREICAEQGPVAQKILRAIVIVNLYQKQKCASQKIIILRLRVFSNVTKL